MRLRATTKVRNDHLISAREERGWNQTKLAKAAGVCVGAVCDLERLDFSNSRSADHALRVAVALGIDPDLVLPADLAGRRLDTTRVAVASVDPARLASFAASHALVHESHEGAVDLRDEVEHLLSFAPVADRGVVAAAFGVCGAAQMTPAEIGAAQDPPVSDACVRDRVERALLAAKSGYRATPQSAGFPSLTYDRRLYRWTGGNDRMSVVMRWIQLTPSKGAPRSEGLLWKVTVVGRGSREGVCALKCDADVEARRAAARLVAYGEEPDQPTPAPPPMPTHACGKASARKCPCWRCVSGSCGVCLGSTR